MITENSNACSNQVEYIIATNTLRGCRGLGRGMNLQVPM